MQTVRNGLYFVWWGVEGHTGKRWFLCAIKNGHVHFLTFKTKLSATCLITDSIPFMRVHASKLKGFDIKKVTEEELVEKLEFPKHTPFDYLKYQMRSESNVI